MPPEFIGPRWREFVEVLERALGYAQLDTREEDFCNDMLERLNAWEDRTILSVSQVNKIHEIDSKTGAPKLR